MCEYLECVHDTTYMVDKYVNKWQAKHVCDNTNQIVFYVKRTLSV